MFEFLLGVFITALLNGIWATRGDPERYQRYWTDETADVYKQLDSVIFEQVYAFDSIVYFQGDSAAIQMLMIPDSTANVQPDTLQLDGL